MLIKFTILCTYTFFVGYVLTWLIFKVKHKKFWGSEIQTKIHMWIPIFVVVLLFALQITWLTIGLTIAVIYGILLDYFTRGPHKDKLATRAYIVLVICGVVVLSFLSIIDDELFLAVWFMAVTADVIAYFSGTLFGYHHLPKSINQQKSWEGVFGQLVGALLGSLKLLTVMTKFQNDILFGLGVIVGLGTIVGDLTNSYIKRKNGFKDWSNHIPGHGGFLDRLSSLSFASLFVFAAVLIVSVVAPK